MSYLVPLITTALPVVLCWLPLHYRNVSEQRFVNQPPAVRRDLLERERVTTSALGTQRTARRRIRNRQLNPPPHATTPQRSKSALLDP